MAERSPAGCAWGSGKSAPMGATSYPPIGCCTILSPKTFGRGARAISAMTLVELMVVLGLVGLIVCISVPALTGYAQNVRLRTATSQVVGLISLARSLAISSQEEHALVIDREKGELRVVELASGQALEQIVRLPSAITLEVQVGGQASSETQFVFRPTGSLKGRSISLVLTGRKRNNAVTITSATGAVTIQR